MITTKQTNRVTNGGQNSTFYYQWQCCLPIKQTKLFGYGGCAPAPKPLLSKFLDPLPGLTAEHCKLRSMRFFLWNRGLSGGRSFFFCGIRTPTLRSIDRPSPSGAGGRASGYLGCPVGDSATADGRTAAAEINSWRSTTNRRGGWAGWTTDSFLSASLTVRLDQTGCTAALNHSNRPLSPSIIQSIHA